MLDIVKSSPICNGNGAGEINGRGVSRRKLTHEQRVSLAADVALGLVRIDPSIEQTATTVGVRPGEILAELKAREVHAKATQAVVETANGATTEITNDTSVEPTVISRMTVTADTPETRIALRRLAASLGCAIELLDREPEAELDFGPYVLVDASSGYRIWEGGLPVGSV